MLGLAQALTRLAQELPRLAILAQSFPGLYQVPLGLAQGLCSLAQTLPGIA
jgi:hypothetical protein